MVQSTTQLLYFKVFITCIHNYIHSLCSTVIKRECYHQEPVMATAGSLPLRCSPGLSGEGEPTPAPRCARLPLPRVGDTLRPMGGDGPGQRAGRGRAEARARSASGRLSTGHRPGRRRRPAARSREVRRRRTWPERGAEHGATGRAGTAHPPPTDRREVANERSEEREERGRAVAAVLRGVLERGIGVDRTPIFVNADEMEMPMPSCLKGLHTRHLSHVDMGPESNRDHGSAP